MLQVMWKNYWTTFVGAALAGLYYLDQIGTKLPTTSGEWLHVGVGLGLAVLGFVAKSATVGSVPPCTGATPARAFVDINGDGNYTSGEPMMTFAAAVSPQPFGAGPAEGNLASQFLPATAATTVATASTRRCASTWWTPPWPVRRRWRSRASCQPTSAWLNWTPARVRGSRPCRQIFTPIAPSSGSTPPSSRCASG